MVTVNGFCLFAAKLVACGGWEATVAARVRIGWVRFRQCGELFRENKITLKR